MSKRASGIRVLEVAKIFSWIDQILAAPGGPWGHTAGQRRAAREGMAIVEGFRGDVLVGPLEWRDARAMHLATHVVSMACLEAA